MEGSALMEKSGNVLHPILGIAHEYQKPWKIFEKGSNQICALIGVTRQYYTIRLNGEETKSRKASWEPSTIAGARNEC